MDAVPAVDPASMEVAGCEQPLWSSRPGAPVSGRPFVPEASAELLRTIAGVLDIRAVFPRISDIVKQVVPHDSLALKFSDRAGRMTLEARSTRDLPEHGWSESSENEEFTIVSDLRRIRSRATDNEPSNVDRCVAAGYRSMLSVRAVAQHQIMQLGFFSKQANAYTPDDVPGARHVADCVAVSVAVGDAVGV